MPGKPKGLPKTGGRKKNTPNKATLEIKAIIDKCVNFDEVVTTLFDLTQGVEVEKGGKVYSQAPDSFAAKILLEYRFGKPKQDIDVTSGGDKMQRPPNVIKLADGTTLII